MNEDLLRQTMQLFDAPEKWNAFCELKNQADNIQNHWWSTLQKEVYRKSISESNPDWDVYIWNNWDIMWFIKGESNKSLAVHFWGEAVRIFCNYGDLNTSKVTNLIKDNRFDAIKLCLDRIDGSNWETIGWEHRNFHFGTELDGNFPNATSLAWYAGNRTDDFATQIMNKVKKFQTPEITALFKEINEKCQKDSLQ